MATREDAIASVVDRASAFLKTVKVNVNTRKRSDWLAKLAAEKYDSSDAIGRLALAGKAQRILNRIGAAVRDGRLDANDLDRKKLREIAGQGLTDQKANLMMRNTLSTGYNAGFRQQGMADDGVEYWHYQTAGDHAVRPEHRKFDGLILAKDDPLAAKIFPPNDHNCRCTMDGISKAEAEKLVAEGKGTMDIPNFKTVTYIDKVTGAKLETIEGVGPGFIGPPDDSAEAVALLLERQIKQLEDWKP